MKQKTKADYYSDDYKTGYRQGLEAVLSCIEAQKDIFGRSLIPVEIRQDLDDRLAKILSRKFGELNNGL